MRCEFMKGSNHCTILDDECDVVDFKQKVCGVRKNMKDGKAKKVLKR